MRTENEVVQSLKAGREVFEDYMAVYRGRLRGLMEQTADFFSDLITCVRAGIMDPAEIDDALRYACDGIYRMNSLPSNEEIGAWERVWKEVLKVYG